MAYRPFGEKLKSGARIIMQGRAEAGSSRPVKIARHRRFIQERFYLALILLFLSEGNSERLLLSQARF